MADWFRVSLASAVIAAGVVLALWGGFELGRAIAYHLVPLLI